MLTDCIASTPHARTTLKALRGHLNGLTLGDLYVATKGIDSLDELATAVHALLLTGHVVHDNGLYVHHIFTEGSTLKPMSPDAELPLPGQIAALRDAVSAAIHQTGCIRAVRNALSLQGATA